MDTIRVHGCAARPLEPVSLCAGPLSLIFANGDIRYIRHGSAELLRRVYVAVRDHNWRTIAGEMSALAIESRTDSFRISYHMEHRKGDIHFSWQAVISGNASGTIRFEMNGVARNTFRTNRTGFCVLHPASCAGEMCEIQHTDGTRESGRFPTTISPHQPFSQIRDICHQAGNTEVRVAMEGEAFEMEDQRNWSDGSFKTYCRQLAQTYPYELREGDVVRQAVTLSLPGPRAAATPPAVENSTIELNLADPPALHTVPAIGLVAADGIRTLREQSLEAIRQLRLAHLRMDVNLVRADWQAHLASASPALKQLGIPLEVALTLPAGALTPAATAFAKAWRECGLTAARWLILSSSGVTRPGDIATARQALSPQVPLGGGTDAEFVTINRNHPPMEALDFLSFSLNPQVHAFDNLSLVENLESHRALLASARAIAAGRPVQISPLTFRRRFNPDATGAELSAACPELPASVDLRQMSLFGAAWTVGAMAGLSLASCLTFFETSGWRGILMGDQPAPLPELFPAAPGELFPVYHVLRSILTFGAKQCSAWDTGRPLELTALLLAHGHGHRMLLANLTPRLLQLRITGAAPVTCKVLDEASLWQSRFAANFWEIAATRSPVNEVMELSAYAVAQLDWQAEAK